ncbi:hypothetical protein GCM10010145_58510 [Streptomyces ruber]|uniref:Uncharacterized protein n=2 Tax=Streptomyces TaxID=1883 RepID=A0A918EYI9_9ACTN|nr:hypothetical protein GCM10010145_58510 [Streptomyces ruber]
MASSAAVVTVPGSPEEAVPRPDRSPVQDHVTGPGAAADAPSPAAGTGVTARPAVTATAPAHSWSRSTGSGLRPVSIGEGPHHTVQFTVFRPVPHECAATAASRPCRW